MYLIGSELSVPQQFYLHKGAYYGNGLVFHNHPDRGEELVTLEQFADGRKISVSKAGVDNVSAFFLRAQEAISAPGTYDYLKNNCEHTVNRLRTGIAKSPQVFFWGCISFVAAISAYSLLRSK